MLTRQGQAVTDRLVAARREGLAKLMEGWSPEQTADLAELLAKLTRDLLSDPPAHAVIDRAK